MADQRPLKVSSSGIAEFVSGDTIPVLVGGTGASSLSDIDGSALNIYFSSLQDASSNLVPSSMSYLVWDGSVWTASSTPTAAAVAGPLSGLTDVSSSLLPSSMSYLVWDGAQWTASGTPAGVGETNTGSNVGTGVGVFKQKSTFDLEFYSVSGRSGVEAILEAGDNNINVSAVPSEINHEDLSGIGSNTHAQIDSHISSSTVHFTEASIDHDNILNNGTSSHAELDLHTTSSTVHFTEATIDHGSISGLGDDDHPQYLLSSVYNSTSATYSTLSSLTDVSSSMLPLAQEALTWTGTEWTASALPGAGGGEANTGSNVGTGVGVFKQKSTFDLEFYSVSGRSGVEAVLEAGDNNINVSAVPSEINHEDLSGIGSNTHTAIDSHIADATLHFTEGSIDHGAIAGLSDDDHTQYVKADGTRHITSDFTVSGDLTVSTNLYISGTTEMGGGLGAELDALENTIGFTEVSSTRSISTTIDWRDSNKQSYAATGNETLSFTAPSNAASLLLKIVQDTGGGNAIALPAAILWPGGTAPTLTTTGGSVDILTFYYDGFNYYGVASQDFS